MLNSSSFAKIRSFPETPPSPPSLPPLLQTCFWGSDAKYGRKILLQTSPDGCLLSSLVHQTFCSDITLLSLLLNALIAFTWFLFLIYAPPFHQWVSLYQSEMVVVDAGISWKVTLIWRRMGIGTKCLRKFLLIDHWYHCCTLVYFPWERLWNFPKTSPLAAEKQKEENIKEIYQHQENPQIVEPKGSRQAGFGSQKPDYLDTYMKGKERNKGQQKKGEPTEIGAW